MIRVIRWFMIGRQERYSAPHLETKDFPSEEWSYTIRSNGEKDCVYQTLESFALKEALEEGQLEGSLKTVAQGLDEDDNPVIMVVRFR